MHLESRIARIEKMLGIPEQDRHEALRREIAALESDVEHREAELRASLTREEGLLAALQECREGQVGEPEPPIPDPVPTDFPNEPTELPIVLESPWNKKAPESCVPGVGLNRVDGWVGRFGNFDGYDADCATGDVSIVSDENTPVSPGYHRIRWREGLHSGQSAAIIEMLLEPNVTYRRLYTAIWHRFEDAHNDGLWAGHPVGTKLFGFWGVGSGNSAKNRIFLNMFRDEELAPTFGFRMDLQNFPMRTIRPLVGPDPQPIKVGVWQLFEFDFKLNTPGSVVIGKPSNGMGGHTADGELRVWIDGVKYIEATDVAWTDNNEGFRHVSHRPSYGGSSSPKPRTEFTNIAHTRIRGVAQ